MMINANELKEYLETCAKEMHALANKPGCSESLKGQITAFNRVSAFVELMEHTNDD